MRLFLLQSSSNIDARYTYFELDLRIDSQEDFQTFIQFLDEWERPELLNISKLEVFWRLNMEDLPLLYKIQDVIVNNSLNVQPVFHKTNGLNKAQCYW